MSDTTGPAPGVELLTIAVTLCGPCLAGGGGECHSPGCTFWMNRAPDIPVVPLAGRTVVELPDPDGVDDGVIVWVLPHGEIQASQDAGEGLIYEAHGDYLLPAEAEQYGAALIAAAREARRLAAESGQDGGGDA